MVEGIDRWEFISSRDFLLVTDEGEWVLVSELKMKTNSPYQTFSPIAEIFWH